jgi:hypothetical protein
MNRAAYLSASVLFFALCSGASAASVWKKTPRKVLALYSQNHIAEENRVSYFTPIHLHAEMPLNHLGLEVEYVEASKNLPDVTSLEGVRGIITWFPDIKSFKNPNPVCSWLNSAMDAGLKVVMLGEFGVYSSGPPDFRLSSQCRKTLGKLGVEALGAVNVGPLTVDVSASDKEMVGFERQPDPSEFGIVPLVKLRPGGKGLLELTLKDGEQKTSVPVALTQRGGYALYPFALYANGNIIPRQVKWVVNPFRFFEDAFELKGLPRPDATTLNGLRMYMSRLDGDGIFARSEADRSLFAGEVFQKEFIDKYGRSPFTISLIAGFYDLTLYQDANSLMLSRKLLTRANIEPASHGYAHPLDWKTGELALKIPRYAMDAEKEIVESGRIIEDRILFGRRKIELFQWTGNCLPSEEQVAVASRANLLNLNGGGGRFDHMYPSYANLFPLGRKMGPVRQIYAGSFNEFVYTEDWSQKFYGYRDIIETFERTESPRRVKPIDIYVHFYSAQKYAALEALRDVYAWAHKQNAAPIFGSRYARWVQGYFEMKISEFGKSRYRFEGGAALRTIRFDNEERVPDLKSSTGVLGYHRNGSSLYVSLDASDSREIVFTGRNGPGLYLDTANFETAGWQKEKLGVRFRMKGWWKPAFRLGGAAPGKNYRIRTPSLEQTVAADAEGFLSVQFESDALGATEGVVIVERVR